MTEAMAVYGMVFAKLAIGLLAIILQINLMGKGNLAPTSALDQLQNYVLGGIIGAIIYNDQIGTETLISLEQSIKREIPVLLDED